MNSAVGIVLLFVLIWYGTTGRGWLFPALGGLALLSWATWPLTMDLVIIPLLLAIHAL